MQSNPASQQARQRRQRWQVALVLLAVAAGLAAYHWVSRAERVREQTQRLLAQGETVDRIVGHQLRAVHHALLELRAEMDDWPADSVSRIGTLRLKALAGATPGLRTVALLDDQGQVLASNRADLAGRKVADNARLPADANPALLHVSPPLRDASGPVSINLTLPAPANARRGARAIAITLEPDFFRVVLGAVLYAPDMWALVSHPDGGLLVIEPPRPETTGAQLAQPGSLFNRALWPTPGQEPLPAVAEGEVLAGEGPRLVAWRKLMPTGVPLDRPLVLMVSRDQAALLAPWWQGVATGLLLFMLFAGSRVAIVVVVQRRARQAEATRQSLEAQLRESQKHEAIGTLAAGIAHDFNNIIGAILGNAELARQDGTPARVVQDSLAQIRRSGLRARELVRQLLAYARRERAVRGLLQLDAVVDETAAMLRALLPAQAQLKLEPGPTAVLVQADSTQLQQVLMNLATNAWHALPPAGGEIVIGLERLAAGTPPHQALRHLGLVPGPLAHVWVRDNGAGMDEAVRARLFEPFFTTKAVGQGSGLGLSVVKGIVSAHGGAIEVDSTPGRGSCFHLYLPALAAEAQPAAALLRPEPQPVLMAVPMPLPLPLPLPVPSKPSMLAAPVGRHVLVVDDDEVMAEVAARLLQRAGHHVSTARSAAEALARLRSGGIDLVVTDSNMPEVPGIELARQLRQLHPGLPVILSSGLVTDSLRAEAAGAGVRQVLNKEDTFEALAREVDLALAPGG